MNLNKILILIFLFSGNLQTQPIHKLSQRLIDAAISGNTDIVKELIKANADVNATDRIGITALMWAARNGHTDIVKELIKANADVNATDRIGITALMEAVNSGNADTVKELIKAKANVNTTTNYGNTPLIQAAIKGNADIVKELIEAKANVTDISGNTALMWAKKMYNTDIVNLLKLEEAIEKNINLESYIDKLKKEDLWWFLDRAINSNDIYNKLPDFYKKLVDVAGANIDAADNYRGTVNLLELEKAIKKNINLESYIDKLKKEDLWWLLNSAINNNDIYNKLPDVYKKLADVYRNR